MGFLNLEKKIKELIIGRLNLQVEPEEISNAAPIFNSAQAEDIAEASEGESLGLDSIDALELVVVLNKEFKVMITEEHMDIFRSINTMADFLRKNSPIVDQLEVS